MTFLRTAFASALVLGALAAAPAAAETAPAQSCTVEQRAIIDTAYAEAGIRLTRAIAWLEANPNHAHVSRYFGTTPRKILRTNFEMLRTAITSPDRPPIHCNTPRCGNSFAYTDSTIIAFCPTFFRTGIEGRDSQYGTVIHEVSHMILRTRDAAYQDNAERLASLEPATAASNAENYEYFVEMLPTK